MTEDEVITNIDALVNDALKGEHTKFEFIKNTNQLLFAYLCRRDRRKVVDLFKKLQKDFIKEYCKEIKFDLQDYDLVFTIKQLELVIDFYSKEAATLTEMITEYKEYLFSGHIFSSIIMGNERADEDLIDYRFKYLK